MGSSDYLSFWLIPSSRDRAWIQPIIDHLAQTYGSVVFDPHITLVSCPASQVWQTLQATDVTVPATWEQLQEQLQPLLASRLSAIANTTASFEVTVQGMAIGESFAKTVFIRLQRSPSLQDLVQRLSYKLLTSTPAPTPKSTSTPGPIPPNPLNTFDPHISLIYQRLDWTIKDAIAQSIVPPSMTIRLDEIRVVQAPCQFVTHDDVYALQPIWSAPLLKYII